MEVKVQIAGALGTAESAVGVAAAEEGVSVVDGVSLAGMILEGLESLVDSAVSGAAMLDSATSAVLDVAGSAV